MEYELIVIGAGPAGLSASIYAGRSRVKTLLLERETLGGYLLNIESIENYPGFPDGISGVELGSSMIAQATRYGVQFAFAEVVEIDSQGSSILVRTADVAYRSKACIVATGCQPKRLNVPGEDAFAERGVIYCAVCGGDQFQGKPVAVLGGGDSGVSEALYLRRLDCRVTIIETEHQINSKQYLQEKVLGDPNIDILCHTKVEAIRGDEWVSGIDLLDLSNNKRTMLKVDGILVHAGREPHTGFLNDGNLLDAEGAIKIASPKLETFANKIYAAGDVRQGSPRQVATAVGDGVTAALSAYTSCLA